jgi:hypothetical protein
MKQYGIHVVPGDHDDWVVKEDGGRELGHYPVKPTAETVALMVARKRRVEMIVHDRSGAVERRLRPSRGWFAGFFAR